MKNGALLRERHDKFIEKTEILYCTRSKYRENKIYREALISLEIRVVSGQAENYNKLYNEEFDPGSG